MARVEKPDRKPVLKSRNQVVRFQSRDRRAKVWEERMPCKKCGLIEAQPVIRREPFGAARTSDVSSVTTDAAQRLGLTRFIETKDT